jgi:uncharacterized Rossmann fold enzyme
MAVATTDRGRPLSRRRAELPNLEALEIVRPRLEGRRVCVMGSAPLLETAGDLAPDERLITVNGSLSSAPDVVPDVHVINARCRPHITWNRQRVALNAAMVEQSRGRHVGVLALLPIEDGAELATATLLGAQGTTWDRIVAIVRSTKDALAYTTGALDKEADRHLSLSAGLTAVCLALWAGAARIRTEGFSFDAGYAYLPEDAVPVNARGHLRGDKTAIAKLTVRYPGRIVGDLFTRRREQRPRI